MGRYSWSDRYTVEDCLSLSVFVLKRDGVFKGRINSPDASHYSNGTSIWANSSGEEIGKIGFSIDTRGYEGKMWLEYSWTDRATEEKENLRYFVGLVSTLCNWGGRRWWFICTCTKDGIYCGRRVARLYLPPNGKYFGCRYCYELTYQSCRESHKYDGMWLKMGVPPFIGNLIVSREKGLNRWTSAS